MATKAQIAANQSNARHSTGPTTPLGRASVGRNALRHGLAAREANLFGDPEEQARFLAHKAALQKELLPVGEIEEKFFHLHVFSLFQAERSQVFELACEDAWLEDQTNPILIANLQRMARYGEIHERRAARTLAELRKLQFDRFAASEVAGYIAAADESVPISRALPVAQIRRSNLDNSNPNFIAGSLIGADPAVQKRPKPDLSNEPKVDWLANNPPRPSA